MYTQVVLWGMGGAWALLGAGLVVRSRRLKSNGEWIPGVHVTPVCGQSGCPCTGAPGDETHMMSAQEAVDGYACPVCHSGPGDPCTSGRLQLNPPHEERRFLIPRSQWSGR